MATANPSRSVPRPVVAWVGLTAAVAVLLWRLDPGALVAGLGLGDFIAYWSAGRRLSAGANPYDWQALLALQRPLGWAEDFPNMMYYPPWALPLVLPLGLLPFGPARLLWLLVSLGLVLGGADALWRYYGAAAERRWLAWVLALAFVPTLIALRMGQIGPILLLGVVGFLLCERRGCDALAGAALALAAVKPQLLYLLGLGVLVWAVDRRRLSVLGGGALALGGLVGLALLLDPDVLVQYRYAVANPPSGNITPTLGAVLRLALGEERTWLQYVPTVLGVGWFVWHWRRQRLRWSWAEQAPVLVLASFLTTAYGAWVFDLVVLLLPVLHVAAGSTNEPARRAALACFLAINGVALSMNLTEASYPAFIWMTPAVLACYLALRPAHPRAAAVAAA
jgi:hypothetical protein